MPPRKPQEKEDASAKRKAAPTKPKKYESDEDEDEDDDDEDDDDEEEEEEDEDDDDDDVKKKKTKPKSQTKSKKTQSKSKKKATKGNKKAKEEEEEEEEEVEKDISDDDTPLWDDPEEEEDDEDDDSSSKNAFARQFKQIMAQATPTAQKTKTTKPQPPPSKKVKKAKDISSSSEPSEDEEEEEEEENPADTETNNNNEATPSMQAEESRWREIEDAQRELLNSVRAQSDHLTDLSSRNDAFIQKGSERLAQIQTALFDLAQNVRELHAHLEAHDKTMQASTLKLMSAQKHSHTMLKEHAVMLTKTFARVTNIKQTLQQQPPQQQPQPQGSSSSSESPAFMNTSDNAPQQQAARDVASDTLLKAASAFASNAYSRIGPLLQPNHKGGKPKHGHSKGVSLQEARERILRRSPSPPPVPRAVSPKKAANTKTPRSVSPKKAAAKPRSVSPSPKPRKAAAKPRSVSPRAASPSPKPKKAAANNRKPRSVSPPKPKKAASKPRSVSPPPQHKYNTRSRSPPKANAKTAMAFEPPYFEYPPHYDPAPPARLSSSSVADLETLISHLNALDPPTHQDIDALWSQVPIFDATTASLLRFPSKDDVPDAVQRVSIILERLSSRLASEFPPFGQRAAYSPGFPPDTEEEDDG